MPILKVVQASKKYRKNNPEKVASWNRNRRAQRLSVPSELYTVADILGLYGKNCHICLEEIDLNAPRRPQDGVGWEKGLHLDHVTPLFRGGTDLKNNIRPSHAECNLKKNAN